MYALARCRTTAQKCPDERAHAADAGTLGIMWAGVPGSSGRRDGPQARSYVPHVRLFRYVDNDRQVLRSLCGVSPIVQPARRDLWPCCRDAGGRSVGGRHSRPHRASVALS